MPRARSSVSLKDARIAGDVARLFTQKATQTNQPTRYTEGKSRRITFKSMDVYIERWLATEAVRDYRGGFGATGQSIYADVALTRERSVLDAGVVASLA
jgi:hypothetical protein